MKRWPYITILLGTTAGFGLGFWLATEDAWSPAEHEAWPTPQQGEIAFVVPPPSESLQERIRELETALTRAEADSELWQSRWSELQLAYQDLDNSIQRRTDFREQRFQTSRENRLHQELDTIRTVTRLLPGQEAGVEALLRQRQEEMTAAWEARRRGEPAPSSSFDFDSQLAALLTAEQLERYHQYEAAQLEGRLETGATARLHRVSPLLSLSEPQKDAVFAAYYENLRNWNDPEAPIGRDESSRMLEAQMREILSPDQFELWQQIEGDTPGAGGPRRFRSAP